MGGRVKYYVCGRNEIGGVLVLGELDDEVEEVLGLLEGFKIRFVVEG